MLKKGVFSTEEQLHFKLGQEVYTPSQTRSTNTEVFDRPYAGFTGLLSEWSTVKNQQLYKVGILLGIAGPNSGAGGFQRWYHKAVAISDSPLWVAELNNSFHTNLYIETTKEWSLAPNPFGVKFALTPKLALGSRDIFAESSINLSFGRRNELKHSIAFNRLGSNQREIYFSLIAGYRQVFYNGLIQGNGFGDDSAVLGEIKPNLLFLGFDFNHRFNQHDYKFGIRYISAETPTANSHLYVSLAYGLGY